MGNIFSASEIIEIGIQIEKNGRDFYGELVKKAKNTKAQEIFGYLAGEEEKHIKVFQGILEKTEQYQPQGLESDTYFAYMNALASEYVFTQRDQGKKIAQKTKSDQEAIEMGIGFEKDSIIFYEGMKKIVPEDDHKIIEQLIIQEQNHLRELFGYARSSLL